MFGSPETTSGGQALKFAASLRLDIRRISTIKNGKVAIGNRTKITVKKNKVGPPYGVTEFDILFGSEAEVGISLLGEIVDIGSDLGVFKKAGAYFTVYNPSTGEEVIKIQGREKLKLYLLENQDLTSIIHNYILYERGLPALTSPVSYGELPTSSDVAETVYESDSVYDDD
jgi:recombination protein RecA